MSDDFRVVERFTRTAPDQIRYRATVEDPAVFTESWTVEVFMHPQEQPIVEFACHEGLSHRQDLYWQREGPEHANQLGVIDNADEASCSAGQDLFAGQGTAPTLDQLQVLVALVGSVDIEVQIPGFIQCKHLETLRFEELGHRLGTGDDTVDEIAHFGQ